MYKRITAFFLLFSSLLFSAGSGLSFTSTDIRDVAKALSIANNVNLVVDQDIDLKVTIYIQDLPLTGILDALTKSYNLVWVKEGDIYRIKKSFEEQELIINIERDTVIGTLSAKNVKLKDFVDEVVKKAKVSLLIEKGLGGKVSGTLNNISVREGLRTLFEVNGYSLKKRGEVFIVSYGDETDESGQRTAKATAKRKSFDIEVENGRVNMSLTGADLGEVLKEIADQTNMNIITYGQIKGSVDANLKDIPINEVIERILAGTAYTYTIENGILLVGERNATTPSGEALSAVKLVHLKHIKAEGIPALLPKSIPAGNVQVIKEQNGILVMGTQVIIRQVVDFINEIDVPTPQILIEAIIVEFLTDDMYETGIKHAGTNSDSGSIGGTYVPGLSLTTDRNAISRTVKNIRDNGFKFGSIGILPRNFNITLRALETDKLARVLARPKIATLNGYKASINVGTSSYYKVTTGNVETPLTRFQEINSGIKLDITPWISRSGQITAEISPEVSNAGALNTENYPDISRRSMSTTVRLNDGETIVIGGLIKSEERVTKEMVPFLGKIPFLGWLFRYTIKSNVKSELLVYLTPHIITEKDYVDLNEEMKKWLQVDEKDSTMIDDNEENDSTTVIEKK